MRGVMWGAAALGLALAVAGQGRAAGAATGTATGTSGGTSGGVYSEAQAAEGAAIYAERCAMCHGKQAEGTWEVPALRGRFMAHWGRGSLAALSDYLARAMPQFAPGTLSREDNVRLVAFLMKTNGQPAGARALSGDHAGLAGIVVEGLPAGAVK